MGLLEIVYWVGMLMEVMIRWPLRKHWRNTPKVEQRSTWQEKVMLQFLALGMLYLPVIYSATDWLDFADYHLPGWMGGVGVYLMVCAVIIFGRAHVDLKKNWTPYQEIYQGHTMVTTGIYRYIRHPMYASQWVWCLAQLLLLQNWLAGPLDLLLFIPFYRLRVRGEEQMMLDKFGNKYKEYMRRTGSIFIKMK